MASFSVMTRKVENLFPPGTKPSPQSKNPISQAFFDQKIAFLSGVILTEQPGVIAVQEPEESPRRGPAGGAVHVPPEIDARTAKKCARVTLSGTRAPVQPRVLSHP